MLRCWHSVNGNCTVSNIDRGRLYSSKEPCSWGTKVLGTTSLLHLDCQFKWGTPVFLRVLHSSSPTHQTMVQIQEPHLLRPALFLNWQQILRRPWPPAAAWWTEAWQEAWEGSLALASILRCSRTSSSIQGQVRHPTVLRSLSNSPGDTCAALHVPWLWDMCSRGRVKWSSQERQAPGSVTTVWLCAFRLFSVWLLTFINLGTKKLLTFYVQSQFTYFSLLDPVKSIQSPSQLAVLVY